MKSKAGDERAAEFAEDPPPLAHRLRAHHEIVIVFDEIMRKGKA